LTYVKLAVKRNIDRFPFDFMFQLTGDEWNVLRSQFVTFSNDTRKYKPFVFTEHGILMLSSVLNSDKAIEVTICDRKLDIQRSQIVIFGMEYFKIAICDLKQFLSLCNSVLSVVIS